jgi:cystathionine beta-lyase/cystathionine gamma-synthase
VVHSTTKYLGGPLRRRRRRGDRARPALHEKVRFVQNAVGAVPGPFDCFLVHRGLRTLHLRVAAHDANGMAVSAWLKEQAGVEDVRWPGLRGMVSFRHPDAIRIASSTSGLLAGRVARRRRVADRGAAGDDAPVGRGLLRGGAGRPRADCRAGSRRASTSSRTWLKP